MPYTHHSHSGQFCGHARNTLGEMLATARKKRMSVFAMTEHIPRDNEDLYDEEIEASVDSAQLWEIFNDYVAEAKRLQKQVAESQQSDNNPDGFQVLVGFEGEWIRPKESAEAIKSILQKNDFDFFVGSVHHVREIAIDMDRARYERARQACGGTEEQLFEAYFDAQFDMLQQLQPKVVGHFDLIRLYSDEPDRAWRSYENCNVWPKILRNLEFIKTYDGVLEINSSGLRKGMAEPYPQSEICQAFTAIGGEMVLSDDSHGTDHVGTNYARALEFIHAVGLENVAHLTRSHGRSTAVARLSIAELERHPFWTAQG